MFKSIRKKIKEYFREKTLIELIQADKFDKLDKALSKASEEEKYKALIYSINKCNVDTTYISLILTKFLDVNYDNDNAVRLACSLGKLEIVKILYNRGANLRASNDYCLEMACKNGHYNIVKFLLEENKYEKIGWPFVFACERGYIRIVRLLLPYSDIHFHNNDAFKYAAENGELHVIKLLMQVEKFPYKIQVESMKLALENNKTTVVNYLIDKGVPSIKLHFIKPEYTLQCKECIHHVNQTFTTKNVFCALDRCDYENNNSIKGKFQKEM